MAKIKISVINIKGKVEEIEVEEGTEITLKAKIVSSDGNNGNSFLPIVEISNAILVGERKNDPNVCLAFFPVMGLRIPDDDAKVELLSQQ